MDNEIKIKTLEFLKNNPVMNIAAINDRKPLASVVLFYVDDDFNFYFITHVTSHKAKALKKNPKISFTVWKFDEMHVQADGDVTFLEGNEADRIMKYVADSSNNIKDFWPPILQLESNRYSVIKIKCNWLRALDISEKNIKPLEEKFYKII